MTLLWWHWALIGFGFALAELAFPAFVMLWFGLGGLLVMLALLLIPDLPIEIQLALWVVSACVMTYLWFHFFKNKAPRTLTGQAQAELIGEIGIVVARIAPFAPGKVRFQKPIIGSEVWDCLAETDLAVGARVRVSRVEGNKILVEPEEDVTASFAGKD